MFVEYGMLTEDRFAERALKFSLLKNVDGKYFTFEEYRTLVESGQTDKNGDIINLYCSNTQEQYAHIDAAKEKGYDVLLMDGQLDVHWVGLLEQKLEKNRFVRVDSDIVEHIIQKEDIKEAELTDEQKELLTDTVKSQIPIMEKTEFSVAFKSLGENSKPIQITQDEFSRRMKEMSAMQQQMAFYGEMPDTYQVVLNVQHPFIKNLIEEGKDKESLTAETTKDGKLKHLIDLALLSSGMLKGEALSNFVKRSIEMI